MDKHNKEQKNKNKNSKKPAVPQAAAPVMQEPSAVKEGAAAQPGKKSNSSTFKK